MSAEASDLLHYPELQHQIEQWYYREARLLDSREFKTWLELCEPEIRYIVPGRGNPLVDNAARGEERMLSVEQELEGVDSDGLPLRDERFLHLAMRVDRAYKPNSWSENPPARTRRIVGNVEILGFEGELLSVQSNFHLHWARPGWRNFLYAGQRRDMLKGGGEGSYTLARREIVLDMANIEYPTVGLLL